MPYKDLEDKKEWERQHRAQRLARRQELRKPKEERQTARNIEPRPVESSMGLLGLALVGGGALAAYNPPLSLGAGSLVLLTASIYKKDWSWWLIGVVTIILAFFFIWSGRKEEKNNI